MVHPTAVPADITWTNWISQAQFGLQIRKVLYLYSILVGVPGMATLYCTGLIPLQRSLCYAREREEESQGWVRDVLMCISMVVSIMYMKAVNERASLISFHIEFMTMHNNYKEFSQDWHILEELWTSLSFSELHSSNGFGIMSVTWGEV